MSRKILVLDTTLRDGEQTPGAKLNLNEKLEIAYQLKRLNVDIIEAGFSASSPGDFKSVEAIAKNIGDGPMITALARAVKGDIDAVYESVKYAGRPLIHIVLGTSNIHVEKKFNTSKDQVLSMGVEAVKYAKSLLPDVQYSTEDASRSDFEYLWKTIEAVVTAGATMINIPDTVGYAVPEEFGELIKKINYRLKNLNPNVILSVHCHNDTGLATANTLIAVKNGADKVECTINGLGERAGNAALEEVVMGLKLRQEYYDSQTNIVTKEIKNTSKMVSSLMGLDVQVNKAITGENAFAHSSGIHQDGLLKAREAYEIIHPEDVGVETMDLVLTARSGRHAFKNSLNRIGFNNVNAEDFDRIFEDFLILADVKKEVYYHDLFYLMKKHSQQKENAIDGNSKEIDFYELIEMQVISSSISPSAIIKIKRGNEIFKEISLGDGPIDALYTAIKNIVNLDIELKEFKITNISKGKDALGQVKLYLLYNGKTYVSQEVDTDIVKACALAYLNIVNEVLVEMILE